MTHIELEQKTQAMVNNLPIGYAFDNEQFEEMLSKWELKLTKEEANEDFKNLGFEIKPNREVQYAKFKNSKHIIEIMVLCHTEY